MEPQVFPQVESFAIDPSAYRPTNAVQTQDFVPNTSPYNSYDQGLRPGGNQAFTRGANQSAFGQLFNASKRAIPSIGYKLGAGLAGVAGLVQEGVSAAFNDDIDFSWSRAFDSTIMTAFDDAETEIEAANPIYPSRKYLTGNTAQKVFTTSWWTQDAMDGIEFLASAYVPGTQISKVGQATKLTGALSKAGAKLGFDATNPVGLIANTLYATTSESMVEGKEVYDSVKESLKLKFPNMSEAEIDQKAATAASNTFKYNMLYLMAPNFLETKWLHNKKAFDGVRSVKALDQITEEELKSSIGKSALKGLASEGLWEENIQLAVSEYEKAKATGTTNTNDSQFQRWYEGVKGFMKTIPQIASYGLLETGPEAGSYQDQAAGGILLGGIIGGTTSALADREGSNFNKSLLKAYQGNINNYVDYLANTGKSLPDRYNSILKEFGKTDDGKINYVNPQTGEVEVDKTKWRNQGFNNLYQKFLFDQAFKASVKGDKTHHEYAVQDALSDSAYGIATYAKVNNLTKEDIDYIITNKLKDNADAVELQTRKSEVMAYMDLYDQVESDSYSANDFDNEDDSRQFNIDMKKTLFKTSAQIKALEKLSLTAADKTKEGITTLITDKKALLLDLKENKNKIKEAYKQQIFPLLQLKREQRALNEEIAKEKDKSAKDALLYRSKVLDLKVKQLEAIEGTESVELSSKLSSQVQNTNTARSFGSKQSLDIPLKDQVD
jgi:gas vesicle protein